MGSAAFSDTHLGTRGCRSDFPADFLGNISCETLYLVGDIIDGWRLKRSWHWDIHHDEVLRLILRMVRNGTDMVYIPGNHDEMFRTWLPMKREIAGIRLCQDAVHETADGRKLLVVHGDAFGSVVRYARFLALLGDRAYTAALVVNRWFNALRRRLGLPEPVTGATGTRPDTASGACIRRILIVSDAWMPQVNSVVRTLSTIAGELRGLGHVVAVIGPDRFRTIPCPTYPDIRLSLFAARPLARMIAEFRPDALHIATEGPLGMAARRWALRRKHRFTTSFHTRFPEYIHARIGLPVAIPYLFLRRFHNAASGTLVATETLSQELDARGFTRLMRWSRGVDIQRFRPQPREDWGACPARSSSMSDASPSRRTSPPSSIPTCPARRSWSAAAPSSPP